MELIEIIDENNYNEILKVLEANIRTARMMRSEIDRLKPAEKKEEQEEPKQEIKSLEQKEEITEQIDEEFEDEIGYYLADYKSITGYMDKEGLIEILPSTSNYRYKEILMRLQAESVKEIKELEELLVDETDINVIKEIKELILIEREKIRLISEIINTKEEEQENEKRENKIILVPTLSGKILIIDDLEHIPTDYYEAFNEIIKSIIQGTFKQVKRLSHDSADSSICEVRGDGIRVLFTRVSKDSYALITAFLKKTTTSRGYKEFIRNRINAYEQVSNKLKQLLLSEDFIEENAKYVEELFNLLEKPSEKQIKVGGNDE